MSINEYPADWRNPPARPTQPSEPPSFEPQSFEPTRAPSLMQAAHIPTEDVLHLRLAEELEYARRMLDIMGDSLAADSTIIVRHATALQSVDIIGQMLGHIANVVRSSDPPAAVKRIGMCELKARLLRRSLG